MPADLSTKIITYPQSSHIANSDANDFIDSYSNANVPQIAEVNFLLPLTHKELNVMKCEPRNMFGLAGEILPQEG